MRTPLCDFNIFAVPSHVSVAMSERAPASWLRARGPFQNVNNGLLDKKIRDARYLKKTYMLLHLFNVCLYIYIHRPVARIR